MRAERDAILVGIGTVLADDPLLTARTAPPPLKQPVRIIADSRARLPLESRLVQSLNVGKVVAATAEETSSELEAAGVEVWPCGEQGKVDPIALLRRAEVEGISSLLLEGGGQLAAAFITKGLVDEIFWFRAPILIGGDGISAIAGLGLSNLPDAPRWSVTATERIGPDTLHTYIRA